MLCHIAEWHANGPASTRISARLKLLRGTVGLPVNVYAGPPACGVQGDDVTSHVWFGQKGVRSTIHYDESFNYHVQIFGNK